MDSTIWSALRNADRGILRTLVKRYGSPEAAKAAIDRECEDPKNIEEWATFTQNRAYRDEKRAAEANGDPFFFSPGVDLAHGEEWKLSDFPEAMRQWALETTAAAMLANFAEEDAA